MIRRISIFQRSTKLRISKLWHRFKATYNYYMWCVIVYQGEPEIYADLRQTNTIKLKKINTIDVKQSENHLREKRDYCLNQAGPWKTSNQKLVDTYCDEWMTSIDQSALEPRKWSHGLKYLRQPLTIYTIPLCMAIIPNYMYIVIKKVNCTIFQHST